MWKLSPCRVFFARVQGASGGRILAQLIHGDALRLLDADAGAPYWVLLQTSRRLLAVGRGTKVTADEVGW